MPIKPENKARYPANWREIRAAILERAGDCCEFCGRPNHVWSVRGADLWCREKSAMEALARPGEKVYRLVLTIAHLDHQPENNDPANLRALCQRCHLDWDCDHHAESRDRTRFDRCERAGQMRLDLDLA